MALRGLDLSHPPQDILTLQPTSSPLTPAKLCPIFTNSFILTAKHCLLLLRHTYSLLLRTYPFKNLSLLLAKSVRCLTPTQGIVAPLFLPIRLEVPFLELTGNLILPTCPLSNVPSTSLVDTFSGWVEAFPTTNKRAQTLSDLLL